MGQRFRIEAVQDGAGWAVFEPAVLALKPTSAKLLPSVLGSAA